MKDVIIVLVMILSVLGPSIVIGAIGFASIKALGRNPSASPKILLSMMISLIFAEAIAIIALLILFQIVK